jgi:hypothetical protein
MVPGGVGGTAGISSSGFLKKKKIKIVKEGNIPNINIKINF